MRARRSLQIWRRSLIKARLHFLAWCCTRSCTAAGSISTREKSSLRSEAMKILETQVFRGPSVYSLNPVIRMKLDIEDLEEKPSNLLENFTDRLIEMMPTLYEHRCSEGVPGGFIIRLREGTWAGHI